MFNKKTYPILILIAFIAVLTSSCSIEKKIAKEYLRDDSTRTVLLIPPDYIFKKSLKEWQLDSAGALDKWTRDSLLLEESMFLKNIDDSLFLYHYLGNYVAELQNLGFKVYGQDSLISFLSGQSRAFIVNMAQLEIEEYIMPVKEEEQFGDYVYYEEVDLNAINLNSWIEISRVNEDEDKALFFASHYLTDDLEGYFRYYFFTGEVVFNYDIDTIPMENIYRLAALAGYTYAGYTFDYLMNKYIDKRMEQETRDRSKIYYHYSRNGNYIDEAKEDQRFIPMK